MTGQAADEAGPPAQLLPTPQLQAGKRAAANNLLDVAYLGACALRFAGGNPILRRSEPPSCRRTAQSLFVVCETYLNKHQKRQYFL